MLRLHATLREVCKLFVSPSVWKAEQYSELHLYDVHPFLHALNDDLKGIMWLTDNQAGKKRVCHSC